MVKYGKKKFFRKREKQSRFDFCLEIVMILLACIMVFPIYYLIVTTFKTANEASFHPLGLPRNFTLDNYIRAWQEMNYPRAFTNTLIITVCAVAGIVIVTSMAAYSFARHRTKANNTVFMLVLAGIMVPYQMCIISLYKIVSGMGIMDSLGGVILIDIFLCAPQSVFLFKNFINTIPVELEEAARIDGASIYKTFLRVVFPLLKPVIATVVIINSLGVWNDFMTPLMFLSSRENSVILLEVFRNVGQFSVDWTSAFPMLMLGIAPLLIFYIFMQKYIIKGTVAGSVKG